MKGWFLGRVAAVALTACVPNSGTAPTVTVTRTLPGTAFPPATVSSTPSPVGPATTIPGEGTFRVGIDIEPGTHTTTPRPGGYSCVWTRLSSLSGTSDAKIANGSGEGPQYVTIEPSDVAFKSEYCQTWQKIS
jgi:hypothetical protein